MALVELEAGELVLGADGRSCGASYRARVKRALKGTTSDALIVFGPFVGRKIGSQYFVFLAHAGSADDSSYLGLDAGARTDLAAVQRLNCEPMLPALREMYEGYGLISVDYGKLVNYRPAVRLSNGPYMLPTDIRGVREPGGFAADGNYFGTVELEVDEFDAYLRSLLAPPK